MENKTLVIIVARHPDGEGLCRRCGWPVKIDGPTYRAITFGAAMLCEECAAEVYDPARPWDRARDIEEALGLGRRRQ